MCSAFDLCPDPKNPTTIFYLPEQKKKDRALQQFKRRKVIGLLDVLRGIEMYIQGSCRKYRTNLPHSFFKTFLYYVIYSGSKRMYEVFLWEIRCTLSLHNIQRLESCRILSYISWIICDFIRRYLIRIFLIIEWKLIFY